MLNLSKTKCPEKAIPTSHELIKGLFRTQEAQRAQYKWSVQSKTNDAIPCKSALSMLFCRSGKFHEKFPVISAGVSFDCQG